jgi:fumarate reductase subunit C
MRPARMPLRGPYGIHALFGATGLIYLLLGLLALEVVWALGSGEAAWNRVQESFQQPLWIAFHALAFASILFVGVRFFRLFPPAQPPRIGPAKPPPPGVLMAMLYTAWIGVAGVLAGILAGWIF